MCQVSPRPSPLSSRLHFCAKCLAIGVQSLSNQPQGRGRGCSFGVESTLKRPLGKCFVGGIIQAIDVCLGEHKFFLAPQYMIFVLKMVIITVSSLKVPIRITLIRGLAHQRFPLNYTSDSKIANS